MRRLAAILASDVVGYSKAMSENEAVTLTRLKAHHDEIFDPKVAEHNGRIIKLMGDGTLVEFSSVVDAVTCAISIQSALAEAEGYFRLRIGINLGDVIVDGDDVYGDGVNVAARLETLAVPGGICISSIVHESLGNRVEASFSDAGEHKLKNMERPIRIFQWPTTTPTIGLANTQLPSQLTGRPSIAVLPFTNMSGDPEQEYFSDGITEDIITELSRFRWLMVIARNSSFQFKGQSPNIQDVGRQLNVQYVVEGSVRRAANRVRITAQLIDAQNNNHIWGDRYDRDLEDIFEIQDEVTQQIVSTVAGGLATNSTTRSKRKHPENMSAYELVLRGKAHFQHNTKAENALARELFLKAIDLDPEYGVAHTWLAWTHFYDYELGWSTDPEDTFVLGFASARRAVDLDSSDAWAQSGLVYGYVYSRQFDLAEIHMEKAAKQNPNDADILAHMGMHLCYLGRSHEGVKFLELARVRNPFALDWYLWNLGIALYTSKRHESAVAAWREMPNPPTEIFACLAAGYAQLNLMADARECLADFLERCQKELAHYPGDDIEQWREYWFRSFPYKNSSDLEHLLDGLRKAGLPV